MLREFTPAIAAMFAFQVLVVVAFGFLMWFRVLSVYPASDMASFGFLTPLFGVAFGWLILGETITWEFVGALAMVCIGIVLVNRNEEEGGMSSPTFRLISLTPASLARCGSAGAA